MDGLHEQHKNNRGIRFTERTKIVYRRSVLPIEESHKLRFSMLVCTALETDERDLKN